MSQYYIASDGGSPALDVETLTGNTGDIVGPDANQNINVIGSGNITTDGDAVTFTLTISEVSPSAITFTTDDASVVSPDAAGNLNVAGGDNLNTTGNPGTNTITVNQSNVFCGTGSTVDAATVDLVTTSLGGTAAAFTLKAIIVGKADAAAGVGGQVVGTARTDGVTATIIDTPDIIENSDPAIAASSYTFIASGNDVILRATGVLGSTINWSACVETISVVFGV